MTTAKDIQTVKISKITKHPNAHKLKICSVETLEGTLEVVCGASNAVEGMLTILAPCGSTTPTGREIILSQLRGVDSHGMLCSPTDLGVSTEKGLVNLPPETPIGLKLSELSVSALSSTPWFQFKKIDQHFSDSEGRIHILSTEDAKPAKDWSLISETYWDAGQYRYRHYL
ncbi:MAG: hypothetical protein H6621_11350 [Halobacteriovoraceae bacterium]|nr:hypothetical protein [Halobacteriovoraceae bacterium]MCB9095655.1 hypothetical protein [Halobacteriovoraceae bacterium]